MALTQDVMGTQESARTLGVSVRTVQLWVEKGLLKAWKTQGGHRRISRQSVMELLEARQRGEKVVPANQELHLLIVEDDPTMQAYYKALVELLCPEARLQMADNGYEGLIALGRGVPNLMLLDVDMPEMDGIKMLKGVEKLDIPANLKIAVVTGLSDFELQQRGGVPVGIPVYAKPLSVDDLARLIKSVEGVIEEKQI